MIKKYILGALLALSIPLYAYAATPTLMVSGTGNANASVTVTGGEPNAPVVLFYNPTTSGTVQTMSVGTTDQNGYWSGNVNTSANGISWNLPVYVQVAGYQSQPWNAASTSISFSNMSPSMTIGQNGVVYLSGGNGSYYVSSNSNANGISATVNGNAVTLYGNQAGNGNIVICSTGGGCGTIAATVNSNTTGSTSGTVGSPTLSQSALNVSAGGQGSIMLSGGTGPYTVSVPAGSGISTTMVGNTLYVNGNMSGNTTVQVCSANNAGCTPLNVSVGSSSTGSTGTGSTGTLGFTLPLNVGSPAQLMLTGGNGSYYVSSPSSALALANINGNTLTINGSAVGSGMINVCSTGTSACVPISFTVSPALTGTGGGYFYDFDLSYGMTSQDVMELQNRLASEGYFTATATGYFGPLTQSAVMAYQAAHGIPSTGYVGPLTRAELNR
jgi:hypothetical protein